jgi:hypothetical protein
MTRKIHGAIGVPKPRSTREKIARSLRERNEKIREALSLAEKLNKHGVIVTDGETERAS